MARLLPNLLAAALFGAAALLGVASAQPTPEVAIEAPAQPPGAIVLPVERGSHPGAHGAEQWYNIQYNGREVLVLRNVTRPTLTPFLPDPARATGAAVIIAPGGAFRQLSMEMEGWAVARWLADHGVAAFVLKYRLQPVGEVSAPRQPGSGGLSAYAPAVADAQAAMRLVRERAASWGVDPHRVGMMGFSAGAMTTLAVTLAPESDTRPDFIGPIYGPMTAVEVPPDAPPMFVAITADDEIFARGGFGLIESWRSAQRPVELHLYERGRHGFGVPGIPNTTTVHFMDEFYWWMQARGLLNAAAH